MSSIIARILTGICGAIVFGFINRTTQTFSGVYGVIALCATFAVFFALAVLIERYFPGKGSVKPAPASAPAPAPAPAPSTIGSENESDAEQEIEIDAGGAVSPGAMVGSRNKAKGNQTIIVK